MVQYRLLKGNYIQMMKLANLSLFGGTGNMGDNYTIKKQVVLEADLNALLGKVSLDENDEMIYILPEFTDEKDIINEFAPDLNGVAKSVDIPCVMVYDKNNYEYLSSRDVEILLPFIISLSASACYDLMKCFVKKYFADKKRLKVRMVIKKKEDTSYRKIQITGDAEGVIHALDILKDEEDNGV